ncbi:MAG: M4 family metallopeptidase [Bacteroidetes bacterium]|nr:M4 family metallopeptidase [Bacteroidota bacterium]
MFKKISAFVLAFAVAVSAGAAVYTGADAQRVVPGTKKVVISDERQTLAFAVFEQPLTINTGFENWLKQLLKAGNETRFELYATENDKYGMVHYRYRQLYNHVQVEGGVYYVHTRNGKVVSANGEYYKGINVSNMLLLNNAQALDAAVKITGATKYKWETGELKRDQVIKEAALRVCKNDAGQWFLTWKVDVFAHEPIGRNWVFVNAQTGALVAKQLRMYHIDVNGVAVTGHNGAQTIVTDSISPTSYRLKETGRGGGIHTYSPGPTDIFDTDNFWQANAALDEFATDGHWGTEMTYDFFNQRYGRVGQDNAGMPALCQVHDGLYVNAYWNGTNMAYGDGDGVDYFPLTSLEIVGHEYTHGVTEFSAALVYAGESGALNESFSDVFGAAIRFTYNPTAGSWFIGDQIVRPNSSGQPFRNMANPNQFQCADTYGGLWFNNGDIVHYDSGIQNFWFYLLCQGGSGTNDLSNAYNVTAIGMSDASDITYRNLTVYLTPNSTFLDARVGAEQAAEDLFGACSPQVIQTANAWYAVGVGGINTYVVAASAIPSPLISCSVPASVTFNNTSANANVFSWDFGDSSPLSTQNSPTHIYNAAGTYSVTLIASGTGFCSGIDTTTFTVTVNNIPGPIPSSCNPATQNFCCNQGITQVQFNTINYSSANAIDGFSDFTCADSTLLIAGATYPITIHTDANGLAAEYVAAYIDYNNDGAFQTNERIYNTPAGQPAYVHQGIVNTSFAATLNTRLRMRVISDINTITSGCHSPVRGQVEDYMVYFVANTQAPVCNFTVNNNIVIAGGNANFFDLSNFAPTSWNWTFTGAATTSSTSQNPSGIVYNTAGIYPVKLVCANAFGSDSLTQIQYITVVNAANICQNQSLSTLSGILYDSGGPNGDYSDNQNCTFTITPTCANNLTITIDSMDLEINYDYLSIYDGTSASAPLLFFDDQMPSNPTFNSASGSLFIVFSSDGSVTYPGFKLSWTSTQLTVAPSPAFTYLPAGPQNLVPVNFTDNSTNSPTQWTWNFGDNTPSSSLQNPTHTYSAPGTYTVTLLACNCVGCDQISQTITIMPNGISETQSSLLSVYPNPFASQLTFELPEAIATDQIQVRITDASGRLLSEIQPQQHRFALQMELAAGVYFAEVWQNGRRVQTVKLVKN